MAVLINRNDTATIRAALELGAEWGEPAAGENVVPTPPLLLCSHHVGSFPHLEPPRTAAEGLDPLNEGMLSEGGLWVAGAVRGECTSNQVRRQGLVHTSLGAGAPHAADTGWGIVDCSCASNLWCPHRAAVVHSRFWWRANAQRDYPDAGES